MSKTIFLENKFLCVEIIPELGGRISSVIFKPTGKEWVWSNPQLTTRKVEKGSSYDDNWQGGWEELFPNDAIEEFSWGTGRDHGELWFNSWNLTQNDKFKATLTIDNLESDSKFTKIIDISESSMNVKYKGQIPFDDYFLFKLHLAVPLNRDLQIKVNAININKVDPEFGNILNTEMESYFFRPKKDSGLYDFAYLDINKNKVEITDKNNDSMTLVFDDTVLKYFWIFQSQGGWNNHNVVVLEPSTNSKKNIIEALEENKAIKGPVDFETQYKVKFSNK